MSQSSPQSFMIGVLVDVSGSMRKAFALDRSVRGNVERTHAIITTLNRIAKNAIAVHDRHDRMFVGAFGLEDTSTCDLISLLKYTSEYDSSQKATADELESARKDKPDDDNDRVYPEIPRMPTNYGRFNQSRGSDGFNVLIKFAADHDAAHAERWIRKSLSEPQAGVLYTILSRDKELMQLFIEKLPGSGKSAFLDATSTLLGSWGDVSQSTVKESELYKLVHQAVNRFAKVTAYLKQPDNRKPVPRPVKEVSDLLDKLLDTTRDSPSGSTESSTTIRKLFDYIKPFIFGGTPMAEALEHAKEIFDQAKGYQKILFILSDGSSAGDDPFPISEELRKSDVTVIGCFLTSNPISHPKHLLYVKDPEWEKPKWDKGVKKLFDMSSSRHNTEIPVTYFVDAEWELPIEGESRLFLQANSLDMVDEFCNVVFTHVKEGKCLDAVAVMLATVSTATYINVKNSEFEPEKQRGKTCYANAIAAVYHLAMRRIVGREGGVPEFESIRDKLTGKYGTSGSNAKFVIEGTCHNYRLRCKELEDQEIGARHAINHRRPVVATFSMDHWFEFSKFYRHNRKGILEAKDLAVTGLQLIMLANEPYPKLCH